MPASGGAPWNSRMCPVGLGLFALVSTPKSFHNNHHINQIIEMLRQRPPSTVAESSTTNLDSRNGDDHVKAKELFLDEDDQTEMVELLRKQARSQQHTMERVQGGIGTAAAVVALILPFLSESSHSSLVWCHAVYTAVLVLLVSKQHLTIRTSDDNHDTTTPTTSSSTTVIVSFRRLVLFVLSSLPMATWVSAFARRERDLNDLALRQQQQQYFGIHFCLSLISLIMFGGAFLVDFDAQSTEHALDELEASKYRFKSL